MGARKVGIARDWLDSKETGANLVRRTQKVEVIRSEDLPELITVREAAEMLRCHWKTVEKYMAKGILGSRKIMNRRFTTPQMIGDFLEMQRKQNG